MSLIRTVAMWYGLTELSTQEFNALRPGAEKALMATTLYFEKKVKLKLAGKRSGRIYRIGKRGRTYQASAPGEPPAVLSGKLRQSITHIGPFWDGDNVWMEVGTNMKYAAILEFGGVSGNGARILPRPYMRATWLEEQDNMQTMLAKATETKSL